MSNRYSFIYKLRDDFDYTKVAYLPLTKGVIAYFDREDFWHIANYRWAYEKTGGKYLYAHRKENGKTIRMHNQIAGNFGDLVVDHINGDKLDNRKCNLRIVSRDINSLNNQSGCVSFSKERKKYRTRFKFRGISYTAGQFSSKEDAIKAIKEKKMAVIGKFCSAGKHVFYKDVTK